MGWIETRKLGLLLSVAPCRHGERKGGLNWKCNDAEKHMEGCWRCGARIPSTPRPGPLFLGEWGEGGWLVSPGRALVAPAGAPLTDFQDPPYATLPPAPTWPRGAAFPRPLIHKKRSGLACSDDLFCWIERCPCPLSQALCLGASTAKSFNMLISSDLSAGGRRRPCLNISMSVLGIILRNHPASPASLI